MSTEHTQGSLTKEAIRLAWPAVCESFFIALAVIYFFGGETIYRMFFREENIIAYGVNIIHCICIIVLFQVSQVIYMG